jgi:hypothetical protein
MVHRRRLGIMSLVDLAEKGDPITNSVMSPLAEPSLVDVASQGVQSNVDIAAGPSLVDFASQGLAKPKEYQTENENLLESGFSMGKGQFWKGVGSALEVGGMDEWSDEVMGWSQENINDASSAQIDGFGDKLVFATGQLGLPAAAMAGAALAAPFVGLSSAFGATAAGLMASWGMTTGDFISKEEQEDPNHQTDGMDLLISSALTLPDMIPVVRGSRLLSPLGKSVAKVATDTAQKAGGNFVTEVGKAGLQTGAAEGIQDFAGSMAAAVKTESGLDANKIESYARAAMEEAAIGGILGGGLGLATQTFANAAGQVDFDKDYEAQHPVILQDEEGNLSSEFSRLEMVEGAPKQPGFASLAFNTLLGNSTDKVKAQFSNMPKVQALMQQFNLRAKERGPGKFTRNDRARAFEGQLQTAAKAFNKMSKADKKAAWDAKAVGGLDLTIEGHRALHDVLNVQTIDLYNTTSKGKAKTERGLFSDETYLPTFKAQDWNKMSKDTKIVERARQDLESNLELTPEQRDSAMKSLEEQIKSFNQSGDHLSLSRDRKTSKYQNALAAQLEEASKTDSKISKKGKKAIKYKLQSERKSDLKDSPLTLERSLRHFSQDFLNSYRRTDVDESALLDQHIRMVSEHASMIEAFGVDGQIFDDAIFEIAIDAHNAGQAFDAADITRMYDIYRTQQRIHLSPLKSNRVRNIQNGVRSALTMQLLGLSVLVSIPEALTIFMNTGGKAGLQGLVQTIMKGINPKAAGLASEQLGFTLRTAVGHAINRTGEEAFEVGKWENAFIKLTGLPYLQHFLTVWSARANDVYVKDMLSKMNKGKLTENEISFNVRKLNEAGIDHEQALAWAGRGFKEDDLYFEDQYIPAIIGITQDTIVDPSPIDKPLWMNDERFLLLSQLKGFMTVFTNRVMRGWKDRVQMMGPEGNRVLATKLAPYVAMYIAGQIGMQAVREVIKSGDLDEWDEKSMEDRIMAAFGYLGGVGFGVDLVNSFRYRRDPLVSALGPAPSKLADMGRITVTNLEAMDGEGFVDDFLKTMFPNVPFKSLMLDAMGVE